MKSNWLNYLQQDTKLSYRTPLFAPCWGWLSQRESRNLIFSLITGYCRYPSDIQEISCLMNRHFVTEVQLLVRNNFSSAIYKKWQLKSIQRKNSLWFIACNDGKTTFSLCWISKDITGWICIWPLKNWLCRWNAKTSCEWTV